MVRRINIITSMNRDDLKLIILLNLLIVSTVALVLMFPSDSHLEALSTCSYCTLSR